MLYKEKKKWYPNSNMQIESSPNSSFPSELEIVAWVVSISAQYSRELYHNLHIKQEDWINKKEFYSTMKMKKTLLIMRMTMIMKMIQITITIRMMKAIIIITTTIKTIILTNLKESEVILKLSQWEIGRPQI